MLRNYHARGYFIISLMSNFNFLHNFLRRRQVFRFGTAPNDIHPFEALSRSKPTRKLIHSQKFFWHKNKSVLSPQNLIKSTCVLNCFCMKIRPIFFMVIVYFSGRLLQPLDCCNCLRWILIKLQGFYIFRSYWDMPTKNLLLEQQNIGWIKL